MILIAIASLAIAIILYTIIIPYLSYKSYIRKIPENCFTYNYFPVVGNYIKDLKNHRNQTHL